MDTAAHAPPRDGRICVDVMPGGVTIHVLDVTSVSWFARIASWAFCLWMLPAIAIALVARAVCWLVGGPVPPFTLFDNPDRELVVTAGAVTLRHARGETRWDRERISDVRIEDIDGGEDRFSMVCLVYDGALVPLNGLLLPHDARYALRDSVRASLGLPPLPRPRKGWLAW